MCWDFYRGKLEGLDKQVLNATNFQILLETLQELQRGEREVLFFSRTQYGQDFILITDKVDGSDGLTIKINGDGTFMMGMPG